MNATETLPELLQRYDPETVRRMMSRFRLENEDLSDSRFVFFLKSKLEFDNAYANLKAENNRLKLKINALLHRFVEKPKVTL